MRPALRLLRHAGFRRLWLAGATSLVGDWLTFVAVSRLAFDGGGGPLALAMTLAAHALPAALLSPVAGVLVDRFDRRTVLVVANLLQAALTALMALAAWEAMSPAVQALVLARSAVATVLVPAETAALRRLVAEDELVRANALVSTTWSVAYVAGMALGGALAALGPALAIALDGATFLVAAALEAGLPAMRPEGGARRSIARVLARVPRDVGSAWRIALADRPLVRAVLGKAPVGLIGGAGFIAINVVADRAVPFGAAAISLGVLQAVRGAGTGVGPWLSSALRRAGVREGAILHGATALVALGVLAVAHVRGAGALAAMAFAWGAGGGTNWVLTSAALQRLAPDRAIGRLAALDELGATLGLVAGALVGAATGSVAVPLILGLATWGLLGSGLVTGRGGAPSVLAGELERTLRR